LRVHLAKWRQIIQHPERTAVCRYDEIVIFDDEIVYWCYRQIQLQRLPVRAIIKGDESAEFSSRVEQTFALGIFAHSVHIGAIGNSSGDCTPIFSEICRFENVRFEIVELMS